MTPFDRRDPLARTPRWRTLAVLALAVLVLHLWGLGVEPPRLGGEDRDAPVPHSVSTDSARPTGLGVEQAVASGRVTANAPVQVTQVRWVEPPSVPPSPLAQKKTMPAPKPDKPRVEVEPPLEAQVEVEAPAPLPEAMQVAQQAQPSRSGTAAAAGWPPASHLPPSQPPASTKLSYEIEGVIKGLPYRATSTFEWTLAAGRYATRTEMSMFLVGTRVQTSEGSVGPDGLRPERFSDKRRSEMATHFERETGRIRFSSNAPEAALMPGAQDRLSLFMQLAGLLQARPHKAGDVIEFQVAGTGDAEPWRFEVGALQDLDLPAGPLSARWVRRLPRQPHDSTVEMWLAPSLNHLPVRLRISQANGDVADQRLTRLP